MAVREVGRVSADRVPLVQDVDTVRAVFGHEIIGVLYGALHVGNGLVGINGHLGYAVISHQAVAIHQLLSRRVVNQVGKAVDKVLAQVLNPEVLYRLLKIQLQQTQEKQQEEKTVRLQLGHDVLLHWGKLAGDSHDR